MKIRRVIPLLVAALSVTACGVPTRPDRVEYRYSSYDTTISVDLDRAPPAPLVEYPPQILVTGHFWAPGYWIWQGARYSWVSGNWQPERPGYTHVASHWERRGDRWHFQPARYEEHRSARTVQARHEEERTPARHIEQRTAAPTPDVRAAERRGEVRQSAPSVERRADYSPSVRAVDKSRPEVKPAAHAEDRKAAPSPTVKIVEKSRTEVTSNAKAVDKAAPEKALTAAPHSDEKRNVQKVGHTTDRGDANESRERGAWRDGGNRL
jgi:hypothetical protein